MEITGDTELLSFWQRLQFAADSSKAKPSEVADAVRGLLFQVWALYRSGRISSQCYASMFEEYSHKYSHILDEQDTTKGLKNFAETVQSLTSIPRNDCQIWKSELSMPEVRKLPVWQTLVGESEVQFATSCTGSTAEEEVKPEVRGKQADEDMGLSRKQENLTLDEGRAFRPTASRTYSNSEGAKATPRCNFPTSSGRNYTASSAHQSSVSSPGYEACSSGFGRKKPYNRQTEDDTGQSYDQEKSNRPPMFISARQQYVIDCKKKKPREGEKAYGEKAYGARVNSTYGTSRRTLGPRRGPNSKFVPPTAASGSDQEERSYNYVGNNQVNRNTSNLEQPEVEEPLKSIDPKMVELIKNEIMDHGPAVSWNDIAGLEFAKAVIKEIIVWPMLRPDIFKGLRGPPKGILLFGPPGTGKTLIGKCIASQSKATFFSISASTLTSKWVGEGEKMVRALFAVARCHLPAVIFIDEIDSLLSQRTDGEHEASRRIKTEFLVQLDGATTNSDERLLIVGATNRPQEIDEAARRRLVKRLYIPLPDAEARRQIVINLLCQQSSELNDKEIEEITQRTEGYSGADVNILCREAALGPIRSISDKDIEHIDAEQVRPINFKDFDAALMQVRPSVSSKDLTIYIEWNKLYGSGLG